MDTAGGGRRLLSPKPSRTKASANIRRVASASLLRLTASRRSAAMKSSRAIAKAVGIKISQIISDPKRITKARICKAQLSQRSMPPV
jgi:hypothetical protein